MLEDKLGENIYRQVMQTQDFSFPSEDIAGQVNEMIARKKRQMTKLSRELFADTMPYEELSEGKSKQQQRMEKY